MSIGAVAALRVQREQILDLAGSFSAAEWEAPSDCAGWSVRDVIIHLARTTQQLVEPKSAPVAVPDDIEQSQDLLVQEWKGRPASEVLEEYGHWSAGAFDKLEAIHAGAHAERVMDLGPELGHHPVHMLANAMCFDHHCHLHLDVLAPLGPVDRPAPVVPDEAMAASIEWMLAGLPAMCHQSLLMVDRPFTLTLDGPGGGTWTITPGPTVIEGSDPAAAATATSTTAEFHVWGTHRRSWRERDVSLTGDEAYGAAVLDAINVI